MRDGWVEHVISRRWLIAIGALLLLLLILLRDPISQRLVPDPRLNSQIERAQAALASGLLSAPDGSGARELFESVLATDPDQMVARQGLIDVRNAAIARAQIALNDHRLPAARENLALAEALSAPTVQLQPLRARLRDLEEISSDVAGLLAQAEAPGITDEAALGLFNQVLRSSPDNEIALEGRGEVLARWLTKAESLLARKQVRAAQQLVERVVAVDPAHVDLPPVQAELGEALGRLQREENRTIALAQADERAGRIDAAAEKYLRLAEAGSDLPAIPEALHRLAARAASEAQRLAADFDFRRAEASLAKARRWSPQAEEIAIAEHGLAESHQAQKRLARPAAAQDKRRLPELVAQAERAMDRGDYLTPPGTSAWDKLRVAAAIAPSVLVLQRDFIRRSRACFEHALSGGQLRRGQSCLEASLAADPAWAGGNDARLRMAERWLAYADERIGASDYAEAEQALAFARRWQPQHPQIKVTEARLRRASRGTR